MSELAFNINGEAFEVPANASGWRVRKMRAKGSPEVVYAREGQPLVLPIGAELDDLRGEVDTTGRYRLDLVDQNNKPIEGAPSGYVQINFGVDAAASEPAGAASVSLGKPTDNVVIEAMRMNAEIARSVVDRFPQMIEAAATLLRAADGAGLPSRPGMATEQDEDDDAGPTTAPAGFDINGLVAQIVPLIVMSLGKGKLKMPDLGSVLDWREASPQKRITEDTSKTAPVEPKSVEMPPIDPATMAHFIAVQSALKPEEAALAREVAGTLDPAALRGWFDELSRLSVPQAVQKIRFLVAGNTEAVS